MYPSQWDFDFFSSYINNVRMRIVSLQTTNNLVAQTIVIWHRKEIIFTGINYWSLEAKNNFHKFENIEHINVIVSINLHPKSKCPLFVIYTKTSAITPYFHSTFNNIAQNFVIAKNMFPSRTIAAHKITNCCTLSWNYVLYEEIEFINLSENMLGVIWST